MTGVSSCFIAPVSSTCGVSTWCSSSSAIAKIPMRSSPFTSSFTSRVPILNHQPSFSIASDNIRMMSDQDLPLIKKFLADSPPLGKVRLVSTNDAAVMEAIVPDMSTLFYAEVPTKGEYANIIDPKINLDMHLRLAGVGAARFEQGVSRGPNPSPTYCVRLLGTDQKTVVMSWFLAWDEKPGDVSEERINAWKSMREKYCGDGKDTVQF